MGEMLFFGLIVPFLALFGGIPLYAWITSRPGTSFHHEWTLHRTSINAMLAESARQRAAPDWRPIDLPRVSYTPPAPKRKGSVFFSVWLALCVIVAFVSVVAHFVAITNGTPIHIEAAFQAWIKVCFWLGVVLLPWPILGAIMRAGR